MKTLIKHTLPVLLLFAAFSACELHQAESGHEENRAIETITIAREIGQQHNAGLDFILQRMKQRTEPFENREEARAFLRLSAEEFIRVTSGVERRRIAGAFSMDRIFQKPETGREESEGRFRNPELSLSSDQLRHIENLFDRYRQTGNGDFFEQVSASDYRDLESSFTPEEKLVIQGVGEVLSASFLYWKEHRGEWLAEIDRLHEKINPKTRNDLRSDGALSSPCSAFPHIPACNLINWEEVILADGGGLIDGVVGNVLYWIIAGPPGWIATGTILGGGAAAASAVELYEQIIDFI